jgi:hypothetical protein
MYKTLYRKGRRALRSAIPSDIKLAWRSYGHPAVENNAERKTVIVAGEMA